MPCYSFNTFLVNDDGTDLIDEDGNAMSLNDPALLAELLEAETDPDMQKYLKKQLKKCIKKNKKVKKEKPDAGYDDMIDEEAFEEDDGYGKSQTCVPFLHWRHFFSNKNNFDIFGIVRVAFLAHPTLANFYGSR